MAICGPPVRALSFSVSGLSLKLWTHTQPGCASLSQKWTDVNVPRGNPQPLGAVSWWINISALCSLLGQFWGAFYTAAQRISIGSEPQFSTAFFPSQPHSPRFLILCSWYCFPNKLFAPWINYMFLFPVILMLWHLEPCSGETVPPRASQFLGDSKRLAWECAFHMGTNKSRAHTLDHLL